jgi:hypothetical protein
VPNINGSGHMSLSDRTTIEPALLVHRSRSSKYNYKMSKRKQRIDNDDDGDDSDSDIVCSS